MEWRRRPAPPAQARAAADRRPLLAIAFFTPAVALYGLPLTQEIQAYALLVLAFLYNLTLLHFVHKQMRCVKDGSLPTFGDGLLCAAMICIVGGFESPFYVILYAILISAGMRLGFARGMLLATPIAVVDASPDHAPPEISATTGWVITRA